MAARITRTLSRLIDMSYYKLSLRTLFGITAVVAVALFVYSRLQPEAWESGVRASDIQSATAEGTLGFGGGEKVWSLSKSDAIELLRTLERCPLTDIPRSPECTFGEERLLLVIRFSLSRGRTLVVVLKDDDLLDEQRLVADISSARQHIARMLLASN